MTPPQIQSNATGGWHYVNRTENGDQPVGPVGDDQIVELVRTGTLTHNSLVWRDGMAQWATIAQTPQLVSQITTPPTQPGAIRSGSDNRIGDDMGIRMLIPVGRSIWAIASGYLGLFSVLGIPAPFALITGIIAIWDIRTHEHRHGMGRAIFGIIMGSLGTLALIVILMGALLNP